MKRLQQAGMVGLMFGGWMGAVCAQQTAPVGSPASARIRLDVVVTEKGNKPATGLPRERFTVLDNGVQRPVASFSEITAGQEPLSVLLVVDAVNTPYTALAYQREQIVKYLRAKDGSLAHPTTLAVLTDKGVQIANQGSRNGNQLGDELEHFDIGLREIGRDQGFYGAQDRLTISLNAMRQIAAFEAKTPGRKLVLWVSPGWPLLSGVEVQLDKKQQDQVYRDVAMLSTQLRQADITLDSVNSWGAGESVGRATYYEDFVDGLSKPAKAQLGNLGLQVLAVQSGGLVLNSSGVESMLQQCVADADDYYELTFEPAPSDKAFEYHGIKVEVPGYKVRTRQGYYTGQ